MISCEAVQTMRVLGEALDAAATAHLAGCPRCRADEQVVRHLGNALAEGAVPEPSRLLGARVLGAATPLLRLNARRAGWADLTRAVAAALVPLPVIIVLDAYLVRAAHAVLSAFLPGPLSFYVVFNYALLLAVALGLTYGAIPILAERQTRLRYEESHA